MTKSWQEIHEWRKATRKALIAQRRELQKRDRRRCDSTILAALEELLPTLADRCVGFYWPLHGEVDLLAFMRRTVGTMREAALPVVTGKELEFWRWSAQTRLRARGSWNIPSPVERILIKPDVLLVPLVGFDEQGYRLGYGTGHYDRSLATTPRPLTIGIGYEMASLRTIYPQPHDIPMDIIVSERGARRYSAAECIGEHGPHTSLAGELAR